MSKTRNRRPTPQPLSTGLTLEGFRSSTALVKQAQTDELFRQVITVLTNERITAAVRVPLASSQPSESYLLGVTQGYEAALTTLNLMTQGLEPLQPSTPAVTYPSAEQEFDNLSANP